MNSNKKSHQQNVDNIEKLSIQVATFEPVYNPSETRLSIANQQLLKTSGDTVLTTVMEAESANNNAISARTAAFGNFDGFVTRIINAVRISDVTEQTVDQCESIVRDLRNKRATEITPPAKAPKATDEETESSHNKIRNGSFDTKVENFNRLVVLLKTLVAYKPNETDLNIESLRAKHGVLKLSNTSCITKEAAAVAAKRQRQIALYAIKTGLVSVALDSKLYVKSAYGANSPQYKSVSGIVFTRIK